MIININIPLSILLLDNYTKSNTIELIDVYLRNQFKINSPYTISSIELKFTDDIIICAEVNIDEVIKNNFDSLDVIEYNPRPDITLISLQQNGIGFADPAKFKEYKRKNKK